MILSPLESRYGVKELYCVFLHALRDKKVFLERIHPLILQDARLSEVSALRQYLAHWAAKKEEHTDLFPHGSSACEQRKTCRGERTRNSALTVAESW
jgi:hypothetical protein